MIEVIVEAKEAPVPDLRDVVGRAASVEDRNPPVGGSEVWPLDDAAAFHDDGTSSEWVRWIAGRPTDVVNVLAHMSCKLICLQNEYASKAQAPGQRGTR